MIDQTENCIVDFTCSIDLSDIGNRTFHAARMRIIDSIGVAIAACDAPTISALINIPFSSGGNTGARIWKTGAFTSLGHAALINGTMVRYLDMSDAYTQISTAHPSDNIAALIALAEANGNSFGDLVLAIIISYEIQCRFCDVVPFHQNGWDQAIIGAPAAAMGASKLLNLGREQTRNALAISITANLPTYQTRQGKLSMWKNIAGPNGGRLGIEAGILALSGITGPQDSFEGQNGMWNLALGKKFEVPIPTDFYNHVFAVEQTDIKIFPIRNACQLPVVLATEMRLKLNKKGISSITIWTDEHSFGAPNKETSFWRPKTREGADHSLPFCIAVALLDGNITQKTFEKKRFLDTDISELIDKISIKIDPVFSRAAPSIRSCRLQIIDENGVLHKLERIWHADDPARIANDETINQKFLKLATCHFSKKKAFNILNNLTEIKHAIPAKKLIDIFAFE